MQINLVRSLALLLLCVSVWSGPASASIIYVKAGSSGTGSSWTTAYGSLQQALNTAVAGDQIWVAQGTYHPTSGTNEDTSFYLVNHVSVYGGFAGTESTLTARADTTGLHTILSGNLGGGYHSKHVVYSNSSIDSVTVFNGFTIRDGKDSLSDYAISGGGAGMYNKGNPSLSNLIIRNNTLIIYANVSGVPFGGGGGLFSRSGSLTLMHVSFISNSVSISTASGSITGSGGGAGFYSDSGTVKVISCIFDNNNATGLYCQGGGYFVAGGTRVRITNSLFTYNNAPNGGTGCLGGGIAILSVNTTITNCTFSQNSNYAIYNMFDSLTLRNTIVYSSASSYGVNNYYGYMAIDYSMLNGYYPGTSNINLLGYAPGFVDPEAGNYSLVPCDQGINAGNDSYVAYPLDASGRPRIYGTVDIGAYELQHAPVMPDTIYVNAAASDPAADGSSWSHAFNNLLTAFRYQCSSGAHPSQVWVAAGDYVPAYDTVNRSSSFNLRNSQKVYGGFNGTETMITQRDSTGTTNVTRLSGELQGDGDFYNNIFHIVFSNTDSTSMINSFTIEGGCGNDPAMILSNASGGGVLNIEGDATFANIIFNNNHAEFGGAFGNWDGSPVLDHVLFTNDTGNFGGAVYTDGTGTFSGISWVTPYSSGTTPLFINDTFRNNYSTFSGGALHSLETALVMDKCLFDHNSAAYYGGGAELDNTQGTLNHITFSGNTVNTDSGTFARGGALFADDNMGDTTTVTDALFVNNAASIGGAVYTDMVGFATLVLNNSTFAGNKSLDGNTLFAEAGTARMQNSIVDSTSNGDPAFGGVLSGVTLSSNLLSSAFPAGAIDGGGNLTFSNPMFADTASGNFTLQLGSPAINAGNNALVDAGIPLDLAGNTRIFGGTVDLGAYENMGFTGVHQTTAALKVHVFPNPAHDVVYVQAEESLRIEIVDVQGRRQGYYDGVKEIDLSSLPAGVYYLRCTSQHGGATVKVVKE